MVDIHVYIISRKSKMMKNTFRCITLMTFTALVCTQSCPDGFVLRENSSTCCKPKTCNKNEGHKLCRQTADEPGEDRCFLCPEGTFNPDRIDTALLSVSIPVCRPPDCQCDHAGGMISNLNDCKFGRAPKLCKCNRGAGYWGRDPNNCYKVDESKMSDIKRPGYELTDEGEVRRCRPGFYKSAPDASVCKPQRICLVISIPGSPTNDTVCKVSMANPPPPHVPDSYPSNTSPRSNSTQPQGNDPSSTQDDLPLIVGVAIASAALIIALLCICCFIRRRFSRNSGNKGIQQPIDREQIHPLNEAEESSGVYDEIGLERRLSEQTGRIVYDTNDCVASRPPSQTEDSGVLDVAADRIDIMDEEFSYSLLSQDSVDTTNGADHGDTSLKMFVPSDYGNPEEDDAQKFCPGPPVVTEFDIIRKSDQKS